MRLHRAEDSAPAMESSNQDPCSGPETLADHLSHQLEQHHQLHQQQRDPSDHCSATEVEFIAPRDLLDPVDIDC